MSKKKKTIIIVALLLVVFIGSISYALWSVTLEQTGSNVVKTGCFTVDMVEETDEINLPEEYPVLDSVGNNYSPFTFTIQNTCNIDSSYSVNLKVDTEKSSLNRDSVKVSLNKGTPQILTDYETAADEEKYQLTTGTLAGASTEGGTDGESVTYDLRLWLDENTSKDEMSKDFYAKIVVENITTSGVEAREVLATADISETEADDVTYTYYSTGELEITGTGRMSDSNGGGLVSEIGTFLISQDEVMSTLTDEEIAVLSTDNSFYMTAILTDNYKVFGKYAKDTLTEDESLCATLPETYDDYKTCLKELGINDENFYSFLDKVNENENVVKITSIKIDEGIVNIGTAQLMAIKLDKLILPSTLEELGQSALQFADIPYLAIPNSVTTIGSGIINDAAIDEIKLPKSDIFTTLPSYIFENATNATIIVPDTITEGFNTTNFAQAENITLNFECSEENAPSGAAELISTGRVVAVNYNYQY